MKKSAKIFWLTLALIILVIAIILSSTAIINSSLFENCSKSIREIEPVEYTEQLIPKLDENGYYTFKTDRKFKVVQLTDVHIGAGYMSTSKDTFALNAVSAMLAEEKPDLVFVTGDIAYPVPFQAGTLNNKSGAQLFAELMEQLGVYWCPCFGNHDTEVYSYYSRESISKLYENKELYPHCLFQSGPDEVDGYGNYVVNVKNSTGEIIQSFFALDSHSYTDGDYFGIKWKYDCIHENQIEWYKNEVAKLTEINSGITPKSLAFFHIPLKEMQDAYYELRDNDFKDTENAQIVYGEAGEEGEVVVYSSNYNKGMFDAFLSEGSTQGLFFGHDHLNNLSINYKGIRMTYGMSIDYLAYPKIYKYGAQRGCTVITINQDGSFDAVPENYYQDKYVAAKHKENVVFTPYADRKNDE